MEQVVVLIVQEEVKNNIAMVHIMIAQCVMEQVVAMVDVEVVDIFID